MGEAAAARTRHDMLTADDAKLERSGRREFGDDEDFGEMLLRVLRDRTRPPNTPSSSGQRQQQHAGGGGGGGPGLGFDGAGGEGRPGSGRKGSFGGEAAAAGGRKSPSMASFGGKKSPTQRGGLRRSPSPEAASMQQTTGAASTSPLPSAAVAVVVAVDLDPFAADAAAAPSAALAVSGAAGGGGAGGARSVKLSSPPVFTEPPYRTTLLAEDMPDGFNPEMWTRVLAARDAKMASEEALRGAAAALVAADAVAAAAAAERRAGASRVAALEARRDELEGNSRAELLVGNVHPITSHSY